MFLSLASGSGCLDAPDLVAVAPSGAEMASSPPAALTPALLEAPPAAPRLSPSISSVTTNLSEYPQGRLPRFERLEITFQVATTAENLQLPYDATPPPGIEPGEGISVDALFTPDNWQTVYTQPAFYYQEFLDEIRGGNEWFYPTGAFSWKVRFSPDAVGTWQYRLVARDASGTIETASRSFEVVASTNRGFIRVSQADPRYFEFDDGSYFAALGYNMNYDELSWINPRLDNEAVFDQMSRDGIQLVRMWLSQWGIYSSAWNPWNAINGTASNYIPWTWETFDEAYPGSDVSMELLWDASRSDRGNPCMFIGAWKADPAVRRNTDYRIQIRYRTEDISGPRTASNPYGFVAKVGGWLWDDGNYCYNSGTGTVVTPYQSDTTPDWTILQGSWNSGANDFLPNFYLVLENVNGGHAYIDYVSIEEDLGNGQFGPNIISKPWMAHHLYMEQRNSYAFDMLLELAEQYDIYLRPVVLEKNEWVANRIDYQGNPIPDDPLCYDGNPSNDPAECPGNQWFYGNGRQMTMTRWLQQAWWRYLQARWGYSPHIHSWELLNEGDPGSALHFTLADEFGAYMHQFAPDDHLVSTSFWHSFPSTQFWANPSFPHIDYADIHQYVPETDPTFTDTALATNNLSMAVGAIQPGGAGKPVIRGETGFVVTGSGPPTQAFQGDTQGVWLHDFIWGGINPGGLIESYWYVDTHIFSQNPDGSYRFDFRPSYRAYRNFLEGIPLNNGHYQDAQAIASHPDLRVWGQKDLSAGRAHLWIQNSRHTWRNVVDGVAIPSVAGTVTLGGFQADTAYVLEWWDTYQPDLDRQVLGTQVVVAQADGTLVFDVSPLAADVAVRIAPATPGSTPTFADVPFAHWAHDYIEALYQAGYVAGCSASPRLYCPDRILSRAESSVFILRGAYGSISDPPYPSPAAPTFADVSPSFWGFGWIESLWRDGFTAGCSASPLLFCPDRQHTRAEGSVFFLRIQSGVDYQPPPAAGLFADVDVGAWYAAWVEAAYREGLLPACQASPLQFCPEDFLDRAWAAYMMVMAKGGLTALSGLQADSPGPTATAMPPTSTSSPTATATSVPPLPSPSPEGATPTPVESPSPTPPETLP